MERYDISYWLRRGFLVKVSELVHALAWFPHNALVKIDDNAITVQLDDQEVHRLEEVTQNPEFKPPNSSTPDVGLELTLARLACAQALDCLLVLEEEGGKPTVLGQQWLDRTREALRTIVDRTHR